MLAWFSARPAQATSRTIYHLLTSSDHLLLEKKRAQRLWGQQPGTKTVRARTINVESICQQTRLTFFVFRFIRISSCIFSVTGLYSDIQLVLSGVILFCGTEICGRQLP